MKQYSEAIANMQSLVTFFKELNLSDKVYDLEIYLLTFWEHLQKA